MLTIQQQGPEHDPREMLKVYHQALASGRFSLEQINQDLSIRSGGRYTTYAQLARAAFGVQEGEREAEATRRVAEREPGTISKVVASLLRGAGGLPSGATGAGMVEPIEEQARAVGDFGTGFQHGATFGLSDELAELIPGGATGAEARQRIEDLRIAQPGAMTASELAGAFAVPGLAGGRAALAGGGGMLSRAARGALVMGGAGAAEGAIAGAAEAEGGLSERLEGARGGMTTGALFGLVLGAFGPPTARLISRMRSSTRGRRLARDIRRASGVADSFEEAFARADARAEAVSRELYAPLDRAFDRVDDPGVLEALQDPELRTIVRSVSKEVANGTRAPSFEELQTIRRKARKRRNTSPATADAGESLSQEMQRVIPDLRRIDRDYARALELSEGLETGYQWANLTAQRRNSTMARRAIAEFGEEGQQAFREGMIHGFVDQLQSRDVDPQIVREMLDMGPEMQARLRNGFQTQEQWEQFMEAVATERTAAGFTRRARRFGKWILWGGLGYGAYRAGGIRGEGSQ